MNNLNAEKIIIIKDAKIQKIIGVESLSNGESYHHVMLVITAKRINHDDFEDLPTKGNVELKI